MKPKKENTPNKIYLMSGHTSTGNLMDLDRRVLSWLDNKNVLVLNLSGTDKDRLQLKGEFFNVYFRKLGAEDVEFISEETQNPEELFDKAGLVYLPGGDTITLLDNIRKKDLTSLISSFDGTLSGNSAGAYSFCPEYLRIRDDEVKTYPAIGLVDFWIKAHYGPKFDSILEELSQEREIYALSDGAAILYDGNLNFIGDIWKFSKGKKDRVK